MRTLLRAAFEILIPDHKGQRAVEETLADWRHAQSAARTPWMRVWTHAQGFLSLVRVTVSCARWQAVDRNVWRAFTWTVVASATGSLILIVRSLNSMPMHLSLGDLAMMAILLVPSAFATLFVLLGSIGLGTRRGEAVPLVGLMATVAVAMFVLIGWIVPAANQKYIMTASAVLSPHVTNTGPDRRLVRPPVTGLTELSLPKVVAVWRSDRPESAAAARRLSATGALTIAGPTFLVPGVAVRHRWIPRGSWRLAQLASGAVGIAAILIGKFAAALIHIGNLRPLAHLVGGTDLWLILIVAWLITALTLRTKHQVLST